MVVVSTAFDKTAFMRLGLRIAGFDKWEAYMEHTNIARFRAWYGSTPKTCAKVWLDLRSSTVDGCSIGADANPMHLLLALRFLKAYPSETELAGTFQISEKSVRKWSAEYTRKLQLLLPQMVSCYTCRFVTASSSAILAHVRFSMLQQVGIQLGRAGGIGFDFLLLR